ncbi:MAG TPA: Calx-beta domain-containing protein, partial [Chitinophagales bacterium]|nr:Calx-beta domain-containing protein [Chitinophagales bacterium]
GVYVSDSADVYAGDNTITTGIAGTGGTGGTQTAFGQAPAGLNGAAEGTLGVPMAMLIDTPDICVIDTNVIEPASGVTFLGVKVTLSKPAPQAITLQYTSVNGTASSVSDYTQALGSLVFQKDEQVKYISVAISHDNITEGDENFTLNLSNPTLGNLLQPTATVTINDLPTGLNDFTSDGGYGLKQNMPNPATDQTNIAFRLPAQGNVRLQLFNLLGGLVATIAEGNFNQGWNNATLDCSNLASGVYVYGFSTGEGFIYKRLTVTQ